MKNTLFISVITIMVSLLIGCDEPDLYYKEYLNVADRNYPGKLQNITTGNGYLRLKFKFTIPPNGSVSKIMLISSLKDTTYFNVTPEMSGKEDSIILDNLKEANYKYTITSLNNQGIKSTPQSYSFKVYGNIYKENLSNLKIKSSSNVNGRNDLRLIFIPNNSSILTKSTFEYTNIDGNIVKYNKLNPSDTIVLQNYKNGTDILLQQGYLPNTSAFDTLYTKKTRLVLP